MKLAIGSRHWLAAALACRIRPEAGSGPVDADFRCRQSPARLHRSVASDRQARAGLASLFADHAHRRSTSRPPRSASPRIPRSKRSQRLPAQAGSEVRSELQSSRPKHSRTKPSFWFRRISRRTRQPGRWSSPRRSAIRPATTASACLRKKKTASFTLTVDPAAPAPAAFVVPAGYTRSQTRRAAAGRSASTPAVPAPTPATRRPGRVSAHRLRLRPALRSSRPASSR